ncbi:MAG: CpaD family pilus assembly lipoprotein [Pirellulaceae bacterium]|nr:CpaD family pilus assembly lipoprotein [Pirellulaceae bacterium]
MRFVSVLAGFVIGTLCLFLLSGCMPNLPNPQLNTATRYPFIVESELVTQQVMFHAGQVTLDQGERDRVGSFLTEFLRGGGGILEIKLVGTLNDAEGEARLQALRQYIVDHGTQSHEIRVSRIPGGNGGGDPIILSYTKYTVEPIQCDRRNAPTANNPTNFPHPDLGCSMRANIAAMVVNPADLERPQAEQPSDATRRGRVIKNYRAGEATEATRGEGESASSIRALGQSN